MSSTEQKTLDPRFREHICFSEEPREEKKKKFISNIRLSMKYQRKQSFIEKKVNKDKDQTQK